MSDEITGLEHVIEVVYVTPKMLSSGGMTIFRTRENSSTKYLLLSTIPLSIGNRIELKKTAEAELTFSRRENPERFTRVIDMNMYDPLGCKTQYLERDIQGISLL